MKYYCGLDRECPASCSYADQDSENSTGCTIANYCYTCPYQVAVQKELDVVKSSTLTNIDKKSFVKYKSFIAIHKVALQIDDIIPMITVGLVREGVQVLHRKLKECVVQLRK